MMLIQKIIEKFDIKPTGIIHVGAHHGQEHGVYKETGCNKFVYFEPNPEAFCVLAENVGLDSGVVIYNCALGNTTGEAEFYLSNNCGQSSSILKPKRHLDICPNIVFKGKIIVSVKRLDDFDISDDFNFLTIDVQGYEMEVLKGAVNALQQIKYIFCEVNQSEIYEGCPYVKDIDFFLEEHGFKRVYITRIRNKSWGNALYKRIKNEIILDRNR